VPSSLNVRTAAGSPAQRHSRRWRCQSWAALRCAPLRRRAAPPPAGTGASRL